MIANVDSRGRRKAENTDMPHVHIVYHSSLLVNLLIQIVFISHSKHAHTYDEELCHLGDLVFQENKVENKN